MPGFIVNHAGRGMNTEGLRIADEGVASFVDIDRIMREQAGFRLGPFELLDLTALDVSHPVMESIYHQFYEEPRFTPSPTTGTRLAGGLIGRKAGEGFYRYIDGKQQTPAEANAPTELPKRVWVSQRHAHARGAVVELLAKAGVPLDDGETPAADSLLIVTPFGPRRDHRGARRKARCDARRRIDTLFPLVDAQRRTLMTTPATTRTARDRAHALFAADGVPVTVIREFDRLRCAARRRDDRQHRLRYRAAADRVAAGHRPRSHARPRLSARPARTRRRAGRADHPDDLAQHVECARRPALSSVAVARAPRAARPVS